MVIELALAICLAGAAVATWIFSYSSRPKSWVGKRIIVLGAAGSIGERVADEFESRGAEEVVRADRRGGTEIIKVDVTNDKQLSEFFQSQHDHVDCVVYCVGVVSGRRLLDHTRESFLKVLDVNLVSCVEVLKRSAPLLTESRGSFVVVSSMMGMLSSANLSAYCASKHGLLTMLECFRLEANDVDVKAVCPYVVDSPMFEGAFSGDSAWERFIMWLFPRLSPSSVARVVVDAPERRATEIVVPAWFGPLVLAVRLLPSPLYQFILALMGGKTGMDGWRGET